MSIQALKHALPDVLPDEALQRDLVAVWPTVESILEAFAKATGLPLFVYLNNHFVFHSSEETLLPFCAAMMTDAVMLARCSSDGAKRATSKGPDEGPPHLCHAGLMTSRRQVDTGCGPILSILFGSKLLVDGEASVRRQNLIHLVATSNSALADVLSSAVEKQSGLTGGNSKQTQDHSELMDAIAKILGRLFAETLGIHASSINLAHEISLMLIGMAASARDMSYRILEFEDGDSKALLSELSLLQRQYATQAQLGLYIVRNFLSDASERRYGEVTRPRFQKVDLTSLVLESVAIHQSLAEGRKITFDTAGLGDLPSIRGVEMELRRLLYNVVNNAIKYSYTSTDKTQRSIRIISKVPYDPGFSQRRFALTIGNYGVGLDRDEKTQAFRSGFRGRQARNRVPVGAGIGLSEAAKIMKLHRGTIRLNSTELHLETSGDATFLTTVDLIFPYAEQ